MVFQKSVLGGDSCFMAVNVWSTDQKKRIEIENSGLDKFKYSDSSTKMSCKSSKASRTPFIVAALLAQYLEYLQ